MVDMMMLCGTRVRYAHLLIHLVGGDPASGVEESRDSSGHHLHRVVDLVQSMYVTSLVLEDSGQSESLMAMILALGH
jgi:hypothetical protein